MLGFRVVKTDTKIIIMRRIYLLLIVVLLGSTSLMAKNVPVTGKWLLTKVEMGEKSQDVYSDINFREDGYAEMGGRVFGNWKYDKKKKLFTIESEMIKEFSGERKVEKLNAGELILKGPKVKMFFIKLDEEKIKAENENSGLEGIWKTGNVDGVVYSLVFELPNKFSSSESSDGSNSTSKGEWIYNGNDKTIIIMTSGRKFRGRNKIVAMNKTELKLKNKGETFSFTKFEKPDIKIERLTFSEDDFYDENGDYKYSEDTEKLPWKDYYSILESLKKVKQLVYNFNVLNTNIDAFETKTLTANVVVDSDEETVIFDNIFKGIDRASISDDEEMPTTNADSNNPIFPFEDNSFRVAGEEEITTPAGTFKCTAVEATGDFDEKIKLWMINDKPGIVAKAILDQEGSFGHYYLFELTEIK